MESWWYVSSHVLLNLPFQVESGWGSMLPTVVLAHMNPVGPAARSNQLNVGDQIININGISLVGLPLSAAQTNIKNVK